MKSIYLLLFLAAMSLSVSAQKEGLNSINRDDLKSYISFLASDEMQGRETGTPMSDVAALYIRTNIMRLGLMPNPSGNDYIQQIPLLAGRIDRKACSLKIFSDTGESVFSTDSLISVGGIFESLEVSGNVVFAGYGFNDNQSGYNDLENIDIQDKIVVMMTRNPEQVKSGTEMAFINNQDEMSKLVTIVRQRPKAILYVYDPLNNIRDVYSSGFMELLPSSTVSFRDDKNSRSGAPFPFFFITQHAADMLLKPTGHTLADMQKSISETGKPVSADLKNISASCRLVVDSKEFDGNNIIGIIEGSDPVLKNECIIYSAHYDHVGVNDDGEAFNGADDNASGTVALLEIAEAFSKLKKKPLRTIVFLWADGEEKGLLGSRYYTYHPAFPLEKTVVDINLDMVGRSATPADTGKFYGYDLNITQPDELIVYTANESDELMQIMNEAAKETGLKLNNLGPDPEYGSSDHASFRAKGIPAVCFHSGAHKDLHSLNDDIDMLDFGKMEKASKMAFLVGFRVANQKNRITLGHN